MNIKFDGTLSDLFLFCKSRGFYYSKEQLYNFYISLKTKPFVILSGISGSGKSKIADLFAEYMAFVTSTDQNYELVSVKPNWTDSRGIFGYHNIINNTYEITPTVKLFIRAIANPDKPYFLLLDEMNLAKVEYYFSDFLSLLESRRISEETDSFKILSKLPSKITLSEAIILAALQLNPSEFQKVQYYRNAPVCTEWLNHSKTKNPTVQFRTELNQNRKDGSNGLKTDGARLAGKAFLAKQEGNLYKLKELSDMDSETRSAVSTLKDTLTYIKQDKIPLHSSPVPLRTSENQVEFKGDLIDEQGNYFVPDQIEIPTNVYVVGTVNVDETTYMFSPKVLDRANVIEYNEIDLYGAYDFGNSQSNNSDIESRLDLTISISNSDSTKQLISMYPFIFQQVFEIFEVLKQKNRHFGYRVFNEISQFILNYVGNEKKPELASQAVDIQILQKILPKLSGSEEELLDVLHQLYSIVEKYKFTYSMEKIGKMISQLQSTGYVTFIE